MVTRPFWIEASISGRKTLLKGGPRNKDGTFYITIHWDNGGTSELALVVTGYRNIENGKLVLDVEAKQGCWSIRQK